MSELGDGLGIVVIGRNEGDRLVRCLASIGPGAPVVYVDSGSTDGSVAAAAAAGARVVNLDLSTPFTAARARNAGRAALDSTVRLVQFIDGDCTVRPGWLDRGRAALAADPGLAAVFGRRREVAPDASTYNWLCDIEWAVPPGPARQFGGDAMLRTSALDQAGGYPDEMIAGEEPDLSMRLGACGWRIACLAEEMTLHDAAMTRFGQWWRRAERSGHAYAELETRHPGEYRRRVRAALFWGAAVPGAALLALAAAAWTGSGVVLLATLAIAFLPVAQFVRVAVRERRARPTRDALTWSLFLLLDKPPHAIGILRYWLSRLRGRRTPLIEYKARAA
ncbi:glycosyltransferase [uncultured Sphingomonas sp.]|uniref:glycosyltransferase n=1 Tax=uncultured Sphingomonas sp. TaxID=158754 RepID=UPI0035CB03CB